MRVELNKVQNWRERAKFVKQDGLLSAVIYGTLMGWGVSLGKELEILFDLRISDRHDTSSNPVKNDEYMRRSVRRLAGAQWLTKAQLTPCSANHAQENEKYDKK